MKDNKGFTLIELLVTITLIAMITVAAGIGITQMFHRESENSAAEYKKKIEDAAYVYYTSQEDGAYEDPTISVLIEGGYLSKDLVNPNTNISIVSYRNNLISCNEDSSTGEVTCQYDLENATTEDTSSYKKPKIISIIENTDSDIKYDSIKLTINATKGTNDIKYYYVSINGEDWKKVSSTYTISNLTENTKYFIKVKVTDTKEEYSQYRLTVTTPKYKYAEVTNVEIINKTADTLTIKATATKGDSEISKYEFIINNSLESKTVETSSQTASTTFVGLSTDKNYEISVQVTDALDKKSTTKTITTNTLSSIEKVVASSTWNSITLTVEKSIDEIVQYKFKIGNETYSDLRDSNTYTFDNLQADTTYSFSVIAVDSEGNSSAPYNISETTKTYELPEITELRIKNKTINSITIIADAVGGSGSISKYQFRKDDGAWSNKQSSNTYTFNNLNENQEYTIKVRVIDENGKYSLEKSITVSTSAYINPTITKITIDDNKTTYNKVVLIADAQNGSSNISYYEIEQIGGSVGKKSFTSTIQTITASQLEPNTEYTFNITAVDSLGNKSNTSTIQTKTSTYNYAEITDISYEAEWNKIKLIISTNNGDSEVESYECVMKDNVNYPYTSSGNTCTFENLSPSQNYTFDVKVYDKNGYASPIKSQEAKTSDYTKSIVDSIVPTLITDSKINIQVNASSLLGTITMYSAKLGENGEWSDWQTSNTFTFDNLDEQTNYTIYAKVMDSNGMESDEISREITTNSYVAPTINDLTGTPTWNTIPVTIKATTGTSNIKSYKFKIGSNSYSEEQTETSYTFTDLEPNTTYIISAIAIDNKNRESEEFSKEFTTAEYIYPTISSINDEETNTTIKLTINAIEGSSDIKEYKVKKGSESWTSLGTQTTVTFEKLEKNTTYTFSIIILDSNDRTSEEYTYTFTTSNINYIIDSCSSDMTLSNCIINYYTTNGEGYGGLYYHDGKGTYGSYEAGDNSYRFSGPSSDINNYVCFGSNEDTCPTDNLYRIIGVFDGRVKLIKATAATASQLGSASAETGECKTTGNCYWNEFLAEYKCISGSCTMRNIWKDSKLNTVNLNTYYLNNLGSTWAAKIDTTTWKVGGNTRSNVYYATSIKTAYTNEITNSGGAGDYLVSAYKTYSAKIGLMYASDYGYAASPNYWSSTQMNYYDKEAYKTDWMFLGSYEWTITRTSDDVSGVFFVSDRGEVSYRGTDCISVMRPVFYLKSSTSVSGTHTGTESDPIRLS